MHLTSTQTWPRRVAKQTAWVPVMQSYSSFITTINTRTSNISKSLSAAWLKWRRWLRARTRQAAQRRSMTMRESQVVSIIPQSMTIVTKTTLKMTLRRKFAALSSGWLVCAASRKACSGLLRTKLSQLLVSKNKLFLLLKVRRPLLKVVVKWYLMTWRRPSPSSLKRQITCLCRRARSKATKKIKRECKCSTQKSSRRRATGGNSTRRASLTSSRCAATFRWSKKTTPETRSGSVPT